MSEIRLYTDGEQATAETLNRPLGDLHKAGQYMSKAQFEANAEANRNIFAGSGIVKNGEPNWSNGSIKSVATPNDRVNQLWFGTSVNTDILNVNGIIIPFKGIADTSIINIINFPQGPTLKNIINDASDAPEMKQGDFSFLKDLSKDILINGTFEDVSDGEIGHDNEDGTIDGWSISGNINVNINENKLRQTTTGATEWGGGASNIYLKVIPGVKYTIKYDYIKGTSNLGHGAGARLLKGHNTHSDYQFKRAYFSSQSEDIKSYEFEFVSSVPHITLQLFCWKSGDEGEWREFDNLSIRQTKEQIIIALDNVTSGDIYSNNTKFEGKDSVSRQDFVFLETWHEDVSEKDIVYPNGNVQHKNTNGYSNLVEGDFAGKETYSLYGEWQEENALVGKGYKWSELSQEDKLEFASNKDNNIYKDGDKIIQVRYRIRIIKGLGNDWAENVIKGNAWSSNFKTYIEGSNSSRLGVKGKKTIQRDLGITDTYQQYAGYKSNNLDQQIGTNRNEHGNSVLSYNNYVYSIPLLLVQRRNDGAYDSTYNIQGSGTFNDDKMWYETEKAHSNIADCFENKKNGTLESGIYGRPDGLFFDVINERDIEDLRMSALKISKNDILNMSNNDILNCKIRGKEIQPRIKKLFTYTNTGDGGVTASGYTNEWTREYRFNIPVTNTLISYEDYRQNGVRGTKKVLLINKTSNKYSIMDWVEHEKYHNNTAMIRYSLNKDEILDDKIAELNDLFDGNDIDCLMALDGEGNSSKIRNFDIDNGNTLYCDIFGNPLNYPQTWINDGVQGNFCLFDYNGESLIPNETITGTKNGDKWIGLRLTKKLKIVNMIIFTDKNKVIKKTLKTGNDDNDAKQWATLSEDTYKNGNGYAKRGNSNRLFIDIDKLELDIDTLVIQVFYGTESNFTKTAPSEKLIEKGQFKCFENFHYQNKSPVKFVSMFTNNVKLGNGAGGPNPEFEGISIELDEDRILSSKIIHQSYNDFRTASYVRNYGIKFFNYLSENYKKYTMHYIFKEMKVNNFADSLNDIIEVTPDSNLTMYAGKLYRFVGFDNGALDDKIIQRHNTDWEKDFAGDTTLMDSWIFVNDKLMTNDGATNNAWSIWNGDGYGDDDQLKVTDNIKIMKDDNDLSVLYGQKKVYLPYFVS